MKATSKTYQEELNYDLLRLELEAFLPSVGEKVIKLRHTAESDADFARMKADKTLVTKADELSEDLVRQWIQERSPQDTIRGEERKQKNGGVRNWIIDPIDGTYNFNHLGKQFSISVGLEENNVSKLGVLFYPAEGIMLSASEGVGAWINDRPLILSKGKTNLKEALIIASRHPMHLADPRFKTTAKQQAKLLSEIRTEDIGWSYTFSFLGFLQGNADAIFHFGATPYDIAGACAVARELNLPMSGYDGKPIDFTKDLIPIVISKNAKLHRMIIESLNSGN